MKIDRIVILLMSLLFMVACAEQEDDFLSNPQDDGKLRLYITYPEGELFNSTRAGTGNPKDPINNDNPDNRVSSMRVMAFRMGEGGKKRLDKTITVDKSNTNPSVPIEVPEGEYVFVVVCNQDADLVAKLANVTNYQALRAVQVKGDAFGNGKNIIMVGDSSDPTYDADGNPVAGKLITINEAGLTTDPYNKFTVRVMRLASRLRFTVYTKQHNVTAGEKKVPELTKLEVTHLPGTMGIKGSNHTYDATTTISLDGGFVSVPDITTDEAGKGYVTKQTIGRMIIPSSVTFSRENGAIVRAHFGAEGTEGAVVLEGVISYKPDGGGQQMYLLNPNTQYHVTLAASPDNLKVAAEVEDWTVENLVGNVGKTYELSSDLAEVYIPHLLSYNFNLPSGLEYIQINAKDILPIKVKFLVKSPPYKFKIVNDELGIYQDVTMTSDEEKIDVNIDITRLMNDYSDDNEVNEQFWGFKLPEIDYLDYWGKPQKFTTSYGSYSLVKKFTFRLEEISAGGGAIQLPSVDYLPECVLPRDIYFIRCAGSMKGVIHTVFANLQVNDNDPAGNFPIISSPYVHVPEAENIDSAKIYCNHLGPDWKLAHQRNSAGSPLIYYTIWLNQEWKEPDPSAPKDMYGWCEFSGGQDIVKVRMGTSYSSPGNPIWPSPWADYGNPLFSSSLRDKKKHPICVIDKTKYALPSVNTSLSGVNFLIIDPSGKPYSRTGVLSVGVNFKDGAPVSYKWNYSADIKVSVKDLNSATEHTIQEKTISSPSDELYFSNKSEYDMYKPEYWSSNNWAGDAAGKGLNVTLEVSNAKCNMETAKIYGSPTTYNVKRMQAYKTKDGKYYVEMDKNGQIETLHTPESAFGLTLPFPFSRRIVAHPLSMDLTSTCERKYGKGWKAAGTDMPFIYLNELNAAGVLRPGRLYYAGGAFYDAFGRWERPGLVQVWESYYRAFVSAFNTNGINDMQKDMPSSTWGYVHGMPPARGYVLCVRQLTR